VISQDSAAVAERGVLAQPEEVWRVAVHRAEVIAPLAARGRWGLMRRVHRKTGPVKCPANDRSTGHTARHVGPSDRRRPCLDRAADLTAQRDALIALGMPGERSYVDHGLTTLTRLGTQRANHR
jgi:hypothetical protein